MHPKRRDAYAAILCVIVLCLVSVTVRAHDTVVLQEEAKPVLNVVPNLTVERADDPPIDLRSLWEERPVIITLFYQRCAGACSPFLRSLTEAVHRVGGLGDYYTIVSISFDPNDDVDRVEMLAADIGFDREPHWIRGITSAPELQQLMDAIGYWIQPIDGTNQFDHPSLIAAVRDGRVVRVLMGNTVEIPRFREMVMELRGTYVPFYTNPNANTVFRCVSYDPATGRVLPGWGLMVLFIPAFLAIVATTLLFRPRRHLSIARHRPTVALEPRILRESPTKKIPV